jgi:hypothetical protein
LDPISCSVRGPCHRAREGVTDLAKMAFWNWDLRHPESVKLYVWLVFRLSTRLDFWCFLQIKLAPGFNISYFNYHVIRNQTIWCNWLQNCSFGIISLFEQWHL